MQNQVRDIDTAFQYSTYETVEADIQSYLNRGAGRKLYWCKNCEVPLLTPMCYRCHTSGRQFIADAKPVFVEERQFLENISGRKLPGNIYKSRNNVYYKGKLLLSLSASGGQIVVKRDNTLSLLDGKAVNPSQVLSLDTAIAANKPVLRFLEKEAIRAIDEIAQKYPNRKLVVSFSGGKDSAVVAHLVERAVGVTRPITLFFADTTLEHPETSDYVQGFADHYSLLIAIERANGDFFDMCVQLEPPSRIMRWCCTVFKANPLNSYLNHNGGILSFDGIRRAESNRRRNYERISGNKKALLQLVFRPILEWSSLAVWLYIFAYKIPYNPAYDKGYARVGCIICPFSTEYDDLLTRKYHPEMVQKWEHMLTSYFHKEYADKFAPALVETWLQQGLWKMRKPHHENQPTAVRLATCPTLQEYSYQLEAPITVEFLEYLKPLGKLTFLTNMGLFKIYDEKKFCITGVIGEDLLAVSFLDGDLKSDLYLFERQIKKAMNCVKCGACIGTCPIQAIKVQPETSFVIDERRCTNCLSCVKSKFTHYGCVALSYKRKRNWVTEV